MLAEEASLDEKIDGVIGPVATWADKIVFYAVPIFGEDVPIVLLLLAGTGIFLTLFFKFINFRAFGLALKTVRGKYSSKDDPGQITHFQALTTALSATVGLGNIAGVAVAIGIGGPGAVFWMVLMGLLGMTSKFTECTLGVTYRDIDKDGKVHGGAMRYLEKGLKEHGFAGLGKVLAIIFAVACVGGALGAGNMFQMNQSAEQVSETFGVFGDGDSWQFGLIVAVMVGAVIIGGIVWIARVTAVLVPVMTIIYVTACVIVLGGYLAEIPAALGTIFREAFSMEAGVGGFIGGLIQGIKRGVFSNEAGLGSAAIAHAPVKTRRPASEGVVALLEPFIDTVVVCLMTALVIVTTGVWTVDANVNREAELRSDPAATAPLVQELDDRDLVHLVEEDKNWVEITLKGNDSTGFVSAATIGDAGEGSNERKLSEDTRVFERPDESSVVLAEMEEESVVQLDETDMEWVMVELKDGEGAGYVMADAITERSGWSGGIWLTSRSFGSVIPWFPYVLAVAVFLFAFSTMISWSYYGEQAVDYLFRGNKGVILGYKLLFCICVVLGAAASLKNVLLLSDALYFAMVAPNLIGLYFLLPRVSKELGRFVSFARRVDGGATLEEADQAEKTNA
ncbi:MAG: alanine/glycine:cation symporter family protein [Verrucomicrobiota bacterium]